MSDAPILEVRGARGADVESVLCDAFHDYPVMRYVLGAECRDYERSLRRLVHVFVSARVLSRHPMYVIEDAGRAVAVGTTTPPGAAPAPPEFQALRDAAWAELGEDAHARYRTLVAAWEQVPFPEPHLHLNMLGTRRSHAGRGYGGRILEAVQEASRRAATRGVSLSTEEPGNVRLYEHCGYRVLHRARVGDTLETWLMFRENSPNEEEAR